MLISSFIFLFWSSTRFTVHKTYLFYTGPLCSPSIQPLFKVQLPMCPLCSEMEIRRYLKLFFSAEQLEIMQEGIAQAETATVVMTFDKELQKTSTPPTCEQLILL